MAYVFLKLFTYKSTVKSMDVYKYMISWCIYEKFIWKKKNHTETNHINFLKFWFHYAHLDWDLCFSLFGEPYEGQRARTWEHLQFISQLKRLKILVSYAVIPCISISAFVCQSKALLAIINFLFNTLKAGNIYENNFHYFWHSNVQVFS